MLTFENGITVYNRKLDPATRMDRWHRTQIPGGCSWYGKQIVSVSSGGLTTADKYTVRVLEDWLAGYVTPDEYNAIEDVDGVWTVRNGDVVALGLQDIEVDGDSITPVTRALTDCFTVTSVGDNRRIALGHLRIEGK